MRVTFFRESVGAASLLRAIRRGRRPIGRGLAWGGGGGGGASREGERQWVGERRLKGVYPTGEESPFRMRSLSARSGSHGEGRKILEKKKGLRRKGGIDHKNCALQKVSDKRCLWRRKESFVGTEKRRGKVRRRRPRKEESHFAKIFN